MLPNPPFQIIAAGICPQGLSAGDYAPGTNCTIQNQGTGLWQVVVDDESTVEGNRILLLSGGSGSNPAEGISFGQSQQVGRAFSFAVYRNSTALAVDLPVQFMVVKIA